MSLIDITAGGVGAPPGGSGGVRGGPVPGSAGSPTPATAPPGIQYADNRPAFAGIKYADNRPAEYRLVHSHAGRIGPDGTFWVDGHPDDGRPLRPRCPVPSCGQEQTDYPGHLCLRPDGSEVWQGWP